MAHPVAHQPDWQLLPGRTRQLTSVMRFVTRITTGQISVSVARIGLSPVARRKILLS